MPACFGVFRTVGVAFALSTALAGCGAQNSLTSAASGVRPPNANNIATEYQTFQTEWNRFLASQKAGDPAAVQNAASNYVAHGYDLADRSCLEYFTALRSLRNQTTFYSNTLSTLFAAGGVIAGLSGVAAPILVGLFAAGGLVPSTVESFNRIYLLAEVGDDLYPAIYRGMAAFREEHLASGADVDRWTADSLVRQHATLCSLPVMQTAVTQGVTNLTLDVGDNGTITVKPKP